MTRIWPLSARVKAFALRPEAPVVFSAGQSLDVHLPGSGRVVGEYALFTSPREYARQGQLHIAVQASRHPAARWMHDKVRIWCCEPLFLGLDIDLTPWTQQFDLLGSIFMLLCSARSAPNSRLASMATTCLIQIRRQPMSCLWQAVPASGTSEKVMTDDCFHEIGSLVSDDRLHQLLFFQPGVWHAEGDCCNAESGQVHAFAQRATAGRFSVPGEFWHCLVDVEPLPPTGQVAHQDLFLAPLLDSKKSMH